MKRTDFSVDWLFAACAPDTELLVGIQIKDTPDCPCLRFVDCQHAAAFVVAPEPVVSQHMAVFDRLPKAEFQTF